MANDFGQFRIDLGRFAKTVGEKHTGLVKKVVLDVLDRVVKKSPVDTGRFKGNWNVGVGRPDLETTDRCDKSGNETLSRGETQVSRIETGEVVVYVTNNLDYAKSLENGHSKQAPAGVLGVTVAEIRAHLGV